MTRYKPDSDGVMYPCAHGGWCDHAEVARIEARLARYEAAIRELAPVLAEMARLANTDQARAIAGMLGMAREVR
jgi:hypothetical protein